MYILKTVPVESEILIALERRMVELAKIINNNAPKQSCSDTTLYIMGMYADALTAYNTIIGTRTGLFEGVVGGRRE